MTSTRKRAYLHWIGALIVLLAAVGGTRLETAQAAATYPRGNIDSPAAGATVSGGVSISGWAIDLAAVSNTGIDLVQIFVDGAYSGDAVYGRPRPDIASGFGKPQFTNSGFLFMLDSTTVGGGTHSLEVRAHSTISGATSAYPETLIVPGPPLTTPRPTATSTPTPLPGTPTPTSIPKPTATPAPASSFPKLFGVNNHLTWSDAAHANIDVDRARAAGMQTVRFDVQWNKLEPNAKNGWSSTYLTQLDTAFNAATSRGLQPLIVLMNTPAWARSNTGSQFSPPTNVQDYADALGSLARRYASTPSLALEVWNEPNQPAFWDAPNGPDALSYSSMLKASYTKIKTYAPNATVVAGSIAYNDASFLQGMYAFGGVVGYYDAISLHPYSGANPPESTTDSYHSFKLAVEQTIQTMAVYNQQNKPIWITEMGWSTADVTDATRAAYLGRAITLVRAWPQVAVFDVYLQDQPDATPGMGLFSPQGNPTNSWLTYASQASAVATSASNVLGSIDSPQDWATPTGSLAVSGWTADLGAASGTGIDQVQVYLDNKYVADATYGSARSDIGSSYGTSFVNSGYQYQLDLSAVSAGNHTIQVSAHSTVNGASTSFLRPITVIAAPLSKPRGSLDSPAAGSTVSGTVRVSGWALDAAAASGSGIDRVQVYLDANYVADATYGTSRADIATSYGAQFAGSGFSYQLNLTGVSAGVHSVKVLAHSTFNGQNTTYVASFSVTIASYPVGNLDSPPNAATVSSTARVSGWAADLGATTGSGVDRVQVYVDGTYLADATYGLQRADIGSKSGAQFAPSGFQYQVDLTALANGSHTLEARARSTVSGKDGSYLATVTVAH